MAYVNLDPTYTSTPSYLGVAPGLSAAACTFCCWVKCTDWSTHPAVVFPLSLYGSVGGRLAETDSFGVEVIPGAALYVKVGNTDISNEPTYTDPGASFTGWIWVAFVVSSGGALTAYCATETILPALHVTSTLTGILTNLYLGMPYGDPSDSGAKYASIKFWNTALTLNQLMAEYGSHTPNLTSGLVYYLSGDNGSIIGQNQAGSGGNWTQTAGTTSFTVDADLPAPETYIIQVSSADDINAGSAATTLTTTLSGISANSTLVLFASSSDNDYTVGGTPAVGAPSVSDSVNGSWPAALVNVDDNIALQRLSVFAKSGAIATSGTTTFTVTWPRNAPGKGLVVLEVGCAGTGGVFVANGQQQTPSTGTDVTTSGNVTPASNAGLLIACSFNDAGPPAPTPGTGFISVGTFLADGYGLGNLATVETKYSTSTTPIAGTFTSPSGAQTATIAIWVNQQSVVVSATSLFLHLRSQPTQDKLYLNNTSTIAKPSGVTPGDFLLWTVGNGAAAHAGPGATLTINTPAGWHLLDTESFFDLQISSIWRNLTQAVFWRFADGTESSTFTATGTDGGSASGDGGMFGMMAAYVGVDPTSPIDSNSKNVGSSTPITVPSIIVSRNNSMLVGVVSAWEKDRGPLSGMNEELGSGDGLTWSDVLINKGPTGILSCLSPDDGVRGAETWVVLLIALKSIQYAVIPLQQFHSMNMGFNF